MKQASSRRYPAFGIEVMPALPAHLKPVAEHMRPEDAREVWLAFGHTPAEALAASLAASVSPDGGCRAWAVLRHGVPEILFGVGAASPFSNTGRPWMLSTGAAGGLAVPFARHCAAYLAEMERGFRRLENHVHVDNRLSVRWLAWLGFRFDPPAPFGVHGALFQRFWKEVPPCLQ